MPLPHLHLFHPGARAAPHLLGWIAAVQEMLRDEANWDGCQFHRLPYDNQAWFDVATAQDNVNRNLGPVIVIQKVQAGVLKRFRERVQRRVSIYALNPRDEVDIWNACEEARIAYEDGEPRIPLRELVAYLIVRKLERLGMWGGESLYKNYLQADDLPKGGFPKQVGDNRLIFDVAQTLVNFGVLSRKESESEWKYSLGEKLVVQPILDSKSFESVPRLQKFFTRGDAVVSANLLDYKE